MSEMQFANTDSLNEMVFEEQEFGGINAYVRGADETDEINYLDSSYQFTLQQIIQLRDFLNRHIDSLALGSIGASTERSSDDPTQLPAEHWVGSGAAKLAEELPKAYEPARKQFGCGTPLDHHYYGYCGEMREGRMGLCRDCGGRIPVLTQL